jgi:hypothetical protein
MRFSTWLREQTKRNDATGTFATWATQNKKFPLSSDPALLKIFIVANKPDLYDAFCIAFIEYAAMPGNQLPKSYSLEDVKAMLL